MQKEGCQPTEQRAGHACGVGHRVACEEEVLAGHLHAEGSPGRATDASKQAAGKLLDRLKCLAFSPLDLHNGFPNTVRVRLLCLHPWQQLHWLHASGRVWTASNTGTCLPGIHKAHLYCAARMLTVLGRSAKHHLCSCAWPSSSRLNAHILHRMQRLLDASVPLPQELIQAQKGQPEQVLQAPASRQHRDAAGEEENAGAGQAAMGPARAAKTRQSKAMHDSGEPHCAAPLPVTPLLQATPAACMHLLLLLGLP